METLELIRLENEQIPIIEVELDPGQRREEIENFEQEVSLGNGANASLVFDLYYSVDIESGGGNTEPSWERVISTCVSVKNVRLEDEDCNKIGIANIEEVERELTIKKIQVRLL